MRNRTIRTVILCAATLAAATPPNVYAGGDAASGAAVAGGALLGIGYGIQAATHSKLQVQVDVFDPKGVDGWPDNFIIHGESAARRAMAAPGTGDGRPATLSELISIDDAGRPLADDLRGGAKAVTQTADTLAALPAGHGAAEDMERVVQDLRAQSRLSAAAAEAFDQFDVDVKNAVRADGGTTPLSNARADLANLRQKLEALRDQPVSAQYASLVGNQARGMFEQGVPAADRAAVPTKAISDAAKQGSNFRRMRIANVLYQIGAAARVASDKKIKIDADPVESLLPKLGVTVTVAQLETFRSPDEILGSLPSFSAVDRIENSGQRLLVLTYGGFTNGVNLGPIVNEVFQMVHTRPQALGTVTDPKNDKQWHNVANASSFGGTGDHNTVIYLENLATPVVKSSTFDPTKFIVAHGALYRRAFSVAAAAFGMPTGNEKPSDLNLLSTQARRQNLEKEAATARKELLAAMTDAVDAADAIKSAAADGKKDAVKAAQTKLQAAADRLKAASVAK